MRANLFKARLKRIFGCCCISSFSPLNLIFFHLKSLNVFFSSEHYNGFFDLVLFLLISYFSFHFNWRTCPRLLRKTSPIVLSLSFARPFSLPSEWHLPSSLWFGELVRLMRGEWADGLARQLDGWEHVERVRAAGVRLVLMWNAIVSVEGGSVCSLGGSARGQRDGTVLDWCERVLVFGVESILALLHGR
jgi:hypothetical protein